MYYKEYFASYEVYFKEDKINAIAFLSWEISVTLVPFLLFFHHLVLLLKDVLYSFVYELIKKLGYIIF